jgi:hypothetical protein
MEWQAFCPMKTHVDFAKEIYVLWIKVILFRKGSCEFALKVVSHELCREAGSVGNIAGWSVALANLNMN